jgi:tripartite-type tricarboxylate transporter receptor subunit TctC
MFLRTVLLAGLLAAPFGCPGQNYPTKPVRIVVPFPPGGPTDTLGRLAAQKLSESLGQTFLIDNRSGATGTIGTGMVAKAPPDGHTLLMSATSNYVAAFLYRKLPYDPERDLAPLVNVATLPFYLVVHPSLPVRSVQELVKFARARPSQLAFSSPGPGSGGHLVMAMFQAATGIELVHIPYKGAAPSITALVAGEVALTWDTISTSHPHVAAGKLRALAVSGAKRSPAVPSVPTAIEAGVPGFETYIWFGMFAPAGTPAPIMEKLNAEINRLLDQPDVKSRITTLSGEVSANTPEQFGRFLAADTPKWKKIIADTGVRVN